MQCHLYKDNQCIVKLLLDSTNSKYLEHNCEGLIENCSFTLQEKKTEIEIVNESVSVVSNNFPQVTIHKIAVPYKVKADVLFYPANIELLIDDYYLKVMSKGVIQKLCNKIPKPIKMGTVYVTDNGDETSIVRSNKIFHLTVSGESRLVNEKDIKTSTRKALTLAEEMGVETICAIPCDCGTLNIDLAAMAQLSTIYTHFSKIPQTSIKNIFIVMSDDETKDIYDKYYKRIFK